MSPPNVHPAKFPLLCGLPTIMGLAFPVPGRTLARLRGPGTRLIWACLSVYSKASVGDWSVLEMHELRHNLLSILFSSVRRLSIG